MHVLRVLHTNNQVEDPELLQLLATSLKPRKSSKKKAAAAPKAEAA
jgi:hypothetical protein